MANPSEKWESIESGKIKIKCRINRACFEKELDLGLGTNWNNSIILKEHSFPSHVLPKAKQHSLIYRACDCPSPASQSCNHQIVTLWPLGPMSSWGIFYYSYIPQSQIWSPFTPSVWEPQAFLASWRSGGRVEGHQALSRKGKNCSSCFSPEDPYCKKGQAD